MRPPEFYFDVRESKERNLAWAQFILEQNGFLITQAVFDKPWGGYFTLSEKSKQIELFLKTYYNRQYDELRSLDLTPKILVIAPSLKYNEPLLSTSYQHHARRKEIQKVIMGPIGIVKSPDDNYPDHYQTYIKREFVKIDVGERHQIIGARHYTAIAEAWIHTDPNNRSDEDDITRI